MNRRATAFIILFIGFIMLGWVGYLYIAQQNQPQTEQGEPPKIDESISEILDTAPTQSDLVEVIVSLQTAPRGFQLSETELTTDMRLASEVGRNVITDMADAVGLYTRHDIFQGETLTTDMLVADPTLIGIEEYGPSSLIPTGSVAAAVAMDRLSGVAYALDEGDYVDVLITFQFYEIDEQFQTLLQNTANFFTEEQLEVGEGEPPQSQLNITVISPFGRFEELPTGDLVHIGPSEGQRPFPIAMLLQNARVIQVGSWSPPSVPQPPTATAEAVAEGEPTPTAPLPPTPTPAPEVLLLALSPQQQLFLKYAVESNANIDFALRGFNDNEIYDVSNIDLNYLIETFDFDIPSGFNYSVDSPVIQNLEITPTPAPVDEGDGSEGS